jgi:hypothetical protein
MKKKYLLGAINITLLFLLAIILLISYNYIGIFSSKETILFIIAMLIVLSIIVYTYLSKKTFVYNVGIYTCFMLNIIFIYLINSANLEYNFINNYIKGNVYTTYNIIVLRKNVLYNNISKLENKTIGSTSPNPKLDTNKYKIKLYNNINDLTEAIQNAEIQSIILSNEDIYNLKKYNSNTYGKFKIIYTYNDVK